MFIIVSGHPAFSTQFNNESKVNTSFRLQEEFGDGHLSTKEIGYSYQFKDSSTKEPREVSDELFVKKAIIDHINLTLKNNSLVREQQNQFAKEQPKQPILQQPQPQLKEQPKQPVKQQPQPQPKEQPKQPALVKPVVYLTFDDGPNQYLNQILDILKQKKAKGTFFMIEPQIWHYQASVKRLVKEGNYPGLHSVTHDVKKVYSSPTSFINEMEKTRQTLLAVTGVDSKLIRAPYGSKPYMTTAFRNITVQHGMRMWDWNIDTEDWKYQRSNPHQIYVNMVSGLARVNKKGSIVIIMHVTKGTATVLPQIIDYLYSRGYQCPAYNPSKPIMMNFWHDTRL